MVVLKKDGILMAVALGLQKVVGPKYDRHEVVGSNQFSFGRASSVELLFGGSINWHALTKGHAATRVAPHIRMHSMGSVNPPLGDRDGVSAQN